MVFLQKFPNISNSVLIFYMSLLGGWGEKLLPARVIDYLETNRLVQIVAAYFLVVFSIEVFNEKVTSIGQSLGYAAIIFVLYIIVSKQTPLFFLASITLLLINYFVYKELTILRDNVTVDTVTREKKLAFIHNIITYITLVTISVGFVQYFIKQYNIYGEDESLCKFIGKFLLEGSNRVYSTKDQVF